MRQMNELILVCNSSSLDSNDNITFWINNTNKIDILHDLPAEYAAAKITMNMVSFQLQPQYEGTFYCGKNVMDEKNIGAGPFAGKTIL